MKLEINVFFEIHFVKNDYIYILYHNFRKYFNVFEFRNQLLDRCN